MICEAAEGVQTRRIYIRTAEDDGGGTKDGNWYDMCYLKSMLKIGDVLVEFGILVGILLTFYPTVTPITRSALILLGFSTIFTKVLAKIHKFAVPVIHNGAWARQSCEAVYGVQIRGWWWMTPEEGKERNRGMINVC